MKNLFRIFLLFIFLLFVVNSFAVQRVETISNVKQIEIQSAPSFSITTPLQKAESGKSQLIAALLAFFLGTLGIHNFYLGYKKKGMTQLFLTLIGYGLSTVGTILAMGGLVLAGLFSLFGWIIIVGVWIWALIDFIKILTGDLKPASGDYTETL